MQRLQCPILNVNLKILSDNNVEDNVIFQGLKIELR